MSREQQSPQIAYQKAFLEAAASRIPILGSPEIILGMESEGYQASLRLEAGEGKSIALPKRIQAIIDRAFAGFPRDELTGRSAIRVERVALYSNRAAIDVSPTIPTPEREGIEAEFIEYPDHGRAVGRRVGFYINQGDYIISLGEPGRGSYWIWSATNSPVPLRGIRDQLAPRTIQDFAELVTTVNRSPHSDFTIHRHS